MAFNNDPEWYPLKETSGSAFFVYAIAKGVNEVGCLTTTLCPLC